MLDTVYCILGTMYGMWDKLYDILNSIYIILIFIYGLLYTIILDTFITLLHVTLNINNPWESTLTPYVSSQLTIHSLLSEKGYWVGQDGAVECSLV